MMTVRTFTQLMSKPACLLVIQGVMIDPFGGTFDLIGYHTEVCRREEKDVMKVEDRNG